jgi:Zinc-finger associated domain (zf-AD)
MSGYRCVNFSDLCRLCSSAGTNNIQIFNDDSLQKKIVECLPITLNDKDKLPKVICNQCLEYVNVFSDFRQACSKAQKMLESCLNTSKLRNNGQVYIKDEVPAKKILKPIQSPSTKLIPNLCNIVTSSPTKQVKKNVITSPSQPDFLSSIMQAVGIQVSFF